MDGMKKRRAGWFKRKNLLKPPMKLIKMKNQTPTQRSALHLFITVILPVSVRWSEGTGKESKSLFHYKGAWSVILHTPSSL